jgi:hypothetical protein
VLYYLFDIFIKTPLKDQKRKEKERKEREKPKAK